MILLFKTVINLFYFCKRHDRPSIPIFCQGQVIKERFLKYWYLILIYLSNQTIIQFLFIIHLTITIHLKDEKAGTDDIFDMSVCNPDTENHDANEEHNESNNQVETNDETQDESILNSSIWSNDNDEELIKTLEIEESKIER